MTKDQILHKFHTSFVEFLDQLIEQFPGNQNLNIARVLVQDQCPPWKLMEKYSEYILPCRDKVDNRDPSFFTNENEGFANLPIKSILSLKEIWYSSQLDDDDKNMIWRWFDLFNVLATKYTEL